MNNEELKEEINQDIPNTEETQEPDCGQEKAEAEGRNRRGSCPAAEEAPEVSAEEEALNTKYMRLMADFQNYKKRVEKEKGDIYALRQ